MSDSEDDAVDVSQLRGASHPSTLAQVKASAEKGAEKGDESLGDARLDALTGPAIPFAELPARIGALLDPPPGAPQPLCPIVLY